MSIGNLKDTGNQGNNLPYQWRVLQGLQAILDEVSLPLTCVEDSIAICDANGDALNINTNGSINTVIQNAAGTSVTTTTVGADVGLDVNIVGPLGQQASADGVSTTLSAEQANVMINVGFERYTNANADTSGISVLSISFASVGTANALVSVDGGMIYQNLAPGETLNLDAGGVMNFYNGNNFFWDTTTNAGSSLIVALNYL